MIFGEVFNLKLDWGQSSKLKVNNIAKNLTRLSLSAESKTCEKFCIIQISHHICLRTCRLVIDVLFVGKDSFLKSNKTACACLDSVLGYSNMNYCIPLTDSSGWSKQWYKSQ